MLACARRRLSAAHLDDSLTSSAVLVRVAVPTSMRDRQGLEAGSRSCAGLNARESSSEESESEITQSRAAAGRLWQAVGGLRHAVQARSRAAQVKEKEEHAMARNVLQGQLTR